MRAQSTFLLYLGSYRKGSPIVCPYSVFNHFLCSLPSRIRSTSFELRASRILFTAAHPQSGLRPHSLFATTSHLSCAHLPFHPPTPASSELSPQATEPNLTSDLHPELAPRYGILSRSRGSDSCIGDRSGHPSRCKQCRRLPPTLRSHDLQVEIQVELEELEEALESQEQGEVFDLDPFDTVVGQEGGESGSEAEGSDDEGDNLSDLSSDAGGDLDEDSDQEDVATDFKHIQDMVNKLDSILKIIFDHFNQAHASSDPVLIPLPGTPLSRSSSPSLSTPTIEALRPISPPTLEEGKALRRAQFHTLLAIFDRTILRTFKSRYTQFVVFWYSSLDPEFADLFQGMLVSKALLEEDQPPVTRAAAASYIASFVSRAQFVDRAGARRVVQVLCGFLRARLDLFDAAAGMGAGMNVAQHSVFYAVAQAVFLIFCFRWRDLLEDQDEVDEFAPQQGLPKKWMLELDVVQRVVTSELNPLKVRYSGLSVYLRPKHT